MKYVPWLILATACQRPVVTAPPVHAGSEKATRPLYEEPTAGSRWAIVLGVTQYDEATLRTLSYPDLDAHAVARRLIERGGYAADHVVVLTTDAERPDQRPTSTILRSELVRILGDRPSSVLIYFSGHGLGVRAEDQGQLSNLLLLQDAELAPAPSSWPTDVALVAELRSAGVEQIVLLIDACRSEFQQGARSRAPASVEPTFRDRLGVSALYCNEFGKPCFEDASFGGGVFTRQLLDVWADPLSDGDQDGRISSVETIYHLNLKLKQVERQEAARQVLAVRGEEGELDLILTPGTLDPTQRLARLLDRAEEQGSVGDRHGFLDSMATIDATLPSWRRRISAPRAAQLYRLEAARAVIGHDEGLAARYLLSLKRINSGDASLSHLWPLETQIGALEAGQANIETGILSQLEAPKVVQEMPELQSTLYIHGERAQTWQPGLPMLLQYRQRGYGVTYTALLDTTAATLPLPPELYGRPVWAGARRASWATFGVSVGLASAAWIGTEWALRRQTDDPQLYYDRLTLAYGASAASAVTLAWALSLELRF